MTITSAGVGVTTIVWYFEVIAQRATISSASDIYEPIAVLWSFGAIAGIFVLSRQWEQRRRSRRAGSLGAGGRLGIPLRPGRPWRLSITCLAELTGGFYPAMSSSFTFSYIGRAVLYSNLVGGTNLPWPIRTAMFYVGTATVGVVFVSVIVRTPLRWALGGPVRSEQREQDNAEVVARAARQAELART
jgi:hypothetical protein